MTIRIEFPFSATFEAEEFVSNSRELRSEVLQTFLANSGLNLDTALEDYEVLSFHGDDNGEFWEVGKGRRY